MLDFKRATSEIPMHKMHMHAHNVNHGTTVLMIMYPDVSSPTINCKYVHQFSH